MKFATRGASSRGQLRRLRATASSFTVVTLLMLLLGSILLFFVSVATNFIIDAQTEIVTGHAAVSVGESETFLRWRFEAGSICAGERVVAPRFETPSVCAQATSLYSSAPFTLEIRQEIEFVFERVGDGDLLVALRPKAVDKVTALYRKGSHPGTEKILTGPIFVTVTRESLLSKLPISIPILASQSIIGREASMKGISSQSLLLGGFVTLKGEMILRDAPYVARVETLNYGDFVLADEIDNLMSLLIRIDDKTGMKILGRVETREIRLASFFGKERVLQLTVLHRIANDPLLTTLWSVTGFLAAVVAVILAFPSQRHSCLIASRSESNALDELEETNQIEINGHQNRRKKYNE